MHPSDLQFIASALSYLFRILSHTLAWKSLIHYPITISLFDVEIFIKASFSNHKVRCQILMKSKYSAEGVPFVRPFPCQSYAFLLKVQVSLSSPLETNEALILIAVFDAGTIPVSVRQEDRDKVWSRFLINVSKNIYDYIIREWSCSTTYRGLLVKSWLDTNAIEGFV
jgi:hypothetical protein